MKIQFSEDEKKAIIRCGSGFRNNFKDDNTTKEQIAKKKLKSFNSENLTN